MSEQLTQEMNGKVKKSKRKMRKCNLDLQSHDSSSSMGSCSDHSDATEVQAIYILWVARREVEEKSKNVNQDMQVQVHGNKGLSLKTSLQKFLQRRKDRRVQASSLTS